jgi:hypothetical protein
VLEKNSEILNPLNQSFHLLDDYRYRWLLVLLAGLYGSIFVIVYNPMGIEQYLINSNIGLFVSIQFAGALGAGTLILTQFVLRRMLGFEKLTLIRFIYWSIFELLMISVVLFVVYGERGRPFWEELLITTEKTFLLATAPFTIAILTIGLIYKRKPTPEAPLSSISLPPLISLKDEQGKPVLSIRVSDVLCLKTEDNYVAVSYLNNGLVEMKLIRNNLKKMEETLRDYPLERIHRSYMINISHIISVDRRSGKTEIKLAHLNEEVFRVSSTYKSNVENILSPNKKFQSHSF